MPKQFCSIHQYSGSPCPICLAATQGVVESICEEATRLVDGPRRGEYGPAKDSFNNIAAVWSAILHKKLKEPLTAHEVAILMAGFKLVRESNKEKRDNRVDAVGYLILAQKIIDETP